MVCGEEGFFLTAKPLLSSYLFMCLEIIIFFKKIYSKDIIKKKFA